MAQTPTTSRRAPGRSWVRRLPAAVLGVLAVGLALSTPAPGASAPATTVKTGAANAISSQGASLGGTVNPGGMVTAYYFQYGHTTKYGSESQPSSLAAGTRSVAVASTITALLPQARYHYRLVAVNATGTVLGADASFATAGTQLAMSLVGLPSPVAFGAPVSLSGTLSGSGADGRLVLLQANAYPFTGGFQNVGNPQLTSPSGTFQFNLISLPVTTQFLVVTLGPGQPVSATLTEYVELTATMQASLRHTSHGYVSATFSGLISPAEVGGRVSVQRLVGGQWRLLTATTSVPATVGSSAYSMTLRLRHGGYYRVFAAPIEDSHVASASQPMLLHIGAASGAVLH